MFAVVALVGMGGAIMAVMLSTKRTRNAAEDLQRARTLANSGISHAVASLSGGSTDDIGSPDAPINFSSGSYWATVTPDADGLYVVTSTGVVRGELYTTQATVQAIEGGVFANAVFAGNSSEDPLYDMELGGTGSQKDEIFGDVYSGGDLSVLGDAEINGSAEAAGTVSGTSGSGGQKQPIPDLQAMDYENSADYNVAKEFTSASYSSDNLGGYAYQLPESNPSHIFRKNPSDRSSENSTTTKDDYYLEDPYDVVSADYDQDGSSATRITLSGTGSEPGENSNYKVFYIDGNLWIHNRRTYSMKFFHNEANGIQVTFVVRGNIYFSDNLFYSNPDKDGVAFIAMKDENVPDSGNIYLGDPEFGTLKTMYAYMYAENDFYDINLDSSGSAKVNLTGIMSAGNRVLIDRDYHGSYGTKHTKLTVDFDERVMNQNLDIPGLPPFSGVDGTSFRVLAYSRVANPRLEKDSAGKWKGSLKKDVQYDAAGDEVGGEGDGGYDGYDGEKY